jgi:hypothetical protein
MTEAEWLACNDPELMLEFIRESASDRKLRLLVCTYFRSQYAPADRRNAVIAIGERHADGQASEEEVNRARAAVSATGLSQSLQVVVSNELPRLAYPVVRHEFVYLLSQEHVAMMCTPIRDIFGNPFRPAAFSPSWRTSTAVTLAQQMYESRDFGAMPILADALQDAGCDSDDVLNHCRGPGPHVRGCWVVDLVLGKA